MKAVARDLPVLSSVEYVIAAGRRVTFHPERVNPSIREWGHYQGGVSGWESPCHLSDNSRETGRWVFVLDLLNHCFWPDPGEPTWSVAYRGEWYSGYWGLAAALKRAVEWGMPITSADYLAEMKAAELHRIFSGQGKIPLFEERLANMREAGRVLQSRWDGDIHNLLEEAKGNGVRVVELLTDSFSSFRDVALYQGRTIYFYKRAQIFVWDLHNALGWRRPVELHDTHNAFNGHPPAGSHDSHSESDWRESVRFYDINALTAFADYKLPQVLRAFGVVSYDSELSEKIDCMENLEAGSEEEVEIRAATVWAVEGFRKAFHEAGKEVKAPEVDNWLWGLGQLEPFREKPYHRCRTIYY